MNFPCYTILIIFTIFLVNFGVCENLKSDHNIIIDNEIFKPNSINLTENGNEYYEYVIKYGEISNDEWFKEAKIVVSSADYKGKCAQWHETRDVNKSSEINYETFKNCLILKINTINLTANNPIMVYVPGFDLSSGDIHSTSGHYLLDKDIVLITVQYRIGVLGFLSTNTEEIPGNAGVLDIILALKWIQKYISYFGGNPNRVTLFGQYKAAGLIGVLTMSPLSKNLFHQIIYHSGSALMSNLTTIDSLNLAKNVASQLSCKNINEIYALNKCLLTANYGELLEAYRNIMIKNDGEIDLITIGGPSHILPDNRSPLDYLQNSRHYPSMGGAVDHPAILVTENFNEKSYSVYSMKYYQEDYENEIRSMNLSLTDDSNNDSNETNNELIREILGSANTIIREIIMNYLPLQIDIGGMEIKSDLIRVLITNKNAGLSTYLYAFKYHSGEYYFPKKQGSWLKNYCTLLDDNIFLFQSEKIEKNNKNKKISRLMIDLWTSFTRNGVPESNEIKMKWPQIVDTEGPYLIIDDEIAIGNDYSIELTPFINCRNDVNCKWVEEINYF